MQNVYTERAVRFLAAFTAVRQAGREAEGDLFVEDLLLYLLSLAQARALLRPTSLAISLSQVSQCVASHTLGECQVCVQSVFVCRRTTRRCGSA